jgi:hypothetical protein
MTLLLAFLKAELISLPKKKKKKKKANFSLHFNFAAYMPCPRCEIAIGEMWGW